MPGSAPASALAVATEGGLRPSRRDPMLAGGPEGPSATHAPEIVMGRSRGRITRIGLLGLLGVQAALAIVFLAEFAVDTLSLRQQAPSYTWREVTQISAGLALIGSLVIGTLLALRLLRDIRRMERSVALARGAFHALIETSFDEWGLTPSEREVAMLALKGFSNAEIAGITGKAEGTVKAQTNAVFRKAGVNGRVQLLCNFTESLLDDGGLSTGRNARPVTRSD